MREWVTFVACCFFATAAFIEPDPWIRFTSLCIALMLFCVWCLSTSLRKGGVGKS